MRIEKNQYQKLAIFSLTSTAIFPALAVSITNIGLSNLAIAFSVSIAQVNWVVVAFFISLTSVVVFAGELGDRFGKKRILLTGILIFIIATVMCALTQDFWVLIFARFIQGIGAAFVVVQSMALAVTVSNHDRQGASMGLLASMSALGTAMGPTVGGVLLSFANWQTLFWFMVPFSLVSLFLCLIYVPGESKKTSNGSNYDFQGSTLIFIASLLYALSTATGEALSPPVNIITLSLAVGIFFLFLRQQKTTKSPLINPVIFRLRLRIILSFNHVLVDAIAMSTLIIGPFYLIYALGVPLVEVGLLMSFSPIVAFFLGYPSGKLVDKFGPQKVVFFGLGLTLIGTLVLPLLSLHWGVFGYLLSMLLITSGRQLFHASNHAFLLRSVSKSLRGTVSGIISLCRNIGLMTGSSVSVAFFYSSLGNVSIQLSAKSEIDNAFGQTFFIMAILLTLSILMVFLFKEQFRVANHED